MSKTKNKQGIHLYKQHGWAQGKPEWYWHIVSKNGRIIARSSETYTRKSSAVKSILVAAEIFLGGKPYELIPYYDHSKKDSPLISYL
jgi:uncharacterized protein YegP (UPF0339 family)